MTPEGKIKAAITATLRNYGRAVYYFMPVQTGYGTATLDYLGFCCGIGFAIEAKRPKGRPSPRQQNTIEMMQEAGVRVFVIDGPVGLEELEQWLSTVIRTQRQIAPVVHRAIRGEA